MTKTPIPVQIRWTDIDANGHVKHSSYYDFAATMRFTFLVEHGLTVEHLREIGIGPVLFREEAIFRREIRFGHAVTIDALVVRARNDYSRWSIRHHLYIGDDTVAGIVNVDGAWIDLKARKLAVPPNSVREVFALFSKADDFAFD